MNPRLDGPVEAVVSRYYRLAEGVYLAGFGFCIGAGAYGFRSEDPATSVAAGLGLLLVAIVGFVPLFDLRTEGVLETSKSPETVRAEFEDAVNPMTAFAFGWADEVRESEADDGSADVVLEGTFLRLFAHEYRLRVSPDGENAIRIRFGDDALDGTVELSIRPSEAGTRVETTSYDERERVTGLLFSMLNARYERRVLEHFGYRNVERSTSVGLRFR